MINAQIKIFHNYAEDSIPTDLTPGTEIYILYAPNPRSNHLILRETHLGLLPHIDGIKGWILSKDLLAFFASEILNEGQDCPVYKKIKELNK